MDENSEEFTSKRKELFQKPVNQIKVNGDMRVSEMVEIFSDMSIQARNLGNAAKIWEKMLKDEERPTIFLGLAGPLIAAGLRNIIADCVKKDLVDVIVSTGAIIYQDMLYAKGGQHYHGLINVNDKELRDLRVNRIYDVFSDDIMFYETDDYVDKYTQANMEPGNYSSRQWLMEIAKDLKDENSILKACYDTKTPVFIPALNDSSIGIGLTKYHANNEGKPKVIIDSIKDNIEMVKIVLNSKASAAVYIGGGVPKNFINDAIVMANFDFGAELEGHKYAIQVSTAHPLDGGLSGSTLGEAIAWGKVQEGARRSMVFSEVSIGLPLIYGYLCGIKDLPKREELEYKL